MKGRKPKPTSAQIAAGDPRKVGKRKLTEKLKSEPGAKRGLPACPVHLKGRARSAWKFWADELAAMNLDSRPDAMMLEGACVHYARAVKADLAIERDGLTLEESMIDETGERILLKVRSNPLVTVSNAAWRQVRSFCSEFGLSPVSRTRLSIEKKDDSGANLLELLSRPRAPRESVTVQ